MGLQQALDYRITRPNVVHRTISKLPSSRVGAWLFSKALHHMDRWLLRVSRGRLSVPRIASGVPVITLATTGARSGERREMPLLGIPAGDDIAVIGSNFGQRNTPGWYFNLRKNPQAEVVYRGRSVAVVAREAEGAERQAIWAKACEIYAGYAAYARRITGRDVHVMVLERAS